MVTLLFIPICISKPQLPDGQMRLVSEEATVFAPFLVIRITVASKCSIYASAFYPACALITISVCSVPISHFDGVTWHPPGVRSVSGLRGYFFSEYFWGEYFWGFTLVLYKLFTVLRNPGETRQLRKARSCIGDVTWVTASVFTFVHLCFVFAIVTYDCHANTVLVGHVTRDVKWLQFSFTVRINDIRAGFYCWVEHLHVAARLG